MSTKLLVVFGATGNQGGSVIKHVQADPELSKQFNIRALTRDPSKPDAKAIADSGVEVVACDINDEPSIKKAVNGADYVFAMTSTVYDASVGKEEEIAQGKRIADACVAQNVGYLIWSSSTDISKGTGGALNDCFIFDTKAIVEEYIRTLPIKASYYVPASFMSNYLGQSKPRPQDDGTFAMAGILTGDTQVPYIDIEGDTGKWITAILADPSAYEGKRIAAGTRMYSTSEVCDILSKQTGKTVTYKTVPRDVFRGFMPGPMGEAVVQMFEWVRDYGYYGADTKGQVEWASKQTRGGKPTEMEAFLKKVNFEL